MPYSGKENPLTDDFLAGESGGDADAYSLLSSKLVRYGSAHLRAVQMSEYLSGRGQRKLSASLLACGHHLLFRYFPTAEKVRLTKADFCHRSILCPLCAVRRAAKALALYVDRIACYLDDEPTCRPYLVTVTIANGPDLLERYQHLRGAMRSYSEMRRNAYKGLLSHRPEFAKAHGGVSSIEFTHSDAKGWHPHFHAVWLSAESIDASSLAREWYLITGDSYIVDVKPFDSDRELAVNLMEVLKYALKFAGLSLEENYLAFTTLKGRRLVDVFGCLRGLKLPEDFDTLTDSTDDLDWLPYLDLAYAYLGDGQYSLTDVVQAAHVALPGPPQVWLDEAELPF